MAMEKIEQGIFRFKTQDYIHKYINIYNIYIYIYIYIYLYVFMCIYIIYIYVYIYMQMIYVYALLVPMNQRVHYGNNRKGTWFS